MNVDPLFSKVVDSLHLEWGGKVNLPQKSFISKLVTFGKTNQIFENLKTISKQMEEKNFSFTRKQMNDLLTSVVSNTLETTWAAKVRNADVCIEEHLVSKMSHETMELYLNATFPALAKLRKEVIIPSICAEAGLEFENNKFYDMRELEQSLADSNPCLAIPVGQPINQLEELIIGTQSKRADRSKKPTSPSTRTSDNNATKDSDNNATKDSENRLSYLKFLGECYTMSGNFFCYRLSFQLC